MNTDVALAQPADDEPPKKGAMRESFDSIMGTDKIDFYASWDLKTPAGKALLFKVAQEADGDLSEHTNISLRIEHLYAAPAEKLDAVTGELIQLVRIVLVTTDGKSYGCFSLGVRKAISLISKCYGPPPWQGGLAVMVKLQKLKNGHNWLTLLPVEIPIGAEPAGRKKL